MKLEFDQTQTAYTSGAQKARAWTEHWVPEQFFCPNCGSSNISKFEINRPVADFFCASCNEEYELKSQKGKFGQKGVDGAFRTMCERLSASNNPSLMLLNYDLSLLKVVNLFIVPKQFFVREIIQERKPLATTARPAGSVAISC